VIQLPLLANVVAPLPFLASYSIGRATTNTYVVVDSWTKHASAPAPTSAELKAAAVDPKTCAVNPCSICFLCYGHERQGLEGRGAADLAFGIKYSRSSTGAQDCSV
jgi:hypothetical protein